MSEIRAAQRLNRIWRELGLPAIAKAPLPVGAGACRTPMMVGDDQFLAALLIAQTTGYEPRRSEA